MKWVAAVSLIYDAFAGVMMTAGRSLFSRLFDLPVPVPPIYAELNGVFLLAVAAGYTIPYRHPESPAGRTYLWVMGPFLKGAGALTFVLDYARRRGPASLLLFAATDAALAVLTLWVLMRGPARAA